MKKIISILAFSLFSLSGAAIAVVPTMTPTIIGYDVTNAAPSGTGNWTHTYTGTIFDLGNGLQDYTGGSGTLNDGVINKSILTTQLFRSSDNTSITVYLDDYYEIASVTLFGGPTNNRIPGSITEATFFFDDFILTIPSTDVGDLNTEGQPVNDLFTTQDMYIEDYIEELVTPYTDRFTISNITGDWGGYYSISEIQVSAVPEPSTYALMLGGLGLVGFMAFKRRRNLV